MAENFPNFVKTLLHILEAKQTPKRIKSKKSMPRHILITLLKTKDKRKVLKADKWYITNRGTSIQMTVDFSSENIKGQKEVVQYFLSVRENNWQPWVLYLERLSLRSEGEISTFSNEGKLKEFVARIPTLKGWLNL